MSSQGNIPTLARAIQLFGYEVGSGADSRLWANPQNFDSNRHKEAFADWIETKTSFTYDEIRDSVWLALRENKNPLLLDCLGDESVEVTNIFHTDRKHQGSWLIIDSGIDNIRILKIDIKDKISLYVFANNKSPLHSAIGVVQEEEDIPTYFKFIELR